MLVPLACKPVDLGTSLLTFTLRGVEIEMLWCDGGGYVPSVVVWRRLCSILSVVEAGQC